MVDEDGTRVGESKTAAIKSSPTPTTTIESRSSFGLAGYYGRFINESEEIPSVFQACTFRTKPLTRTDGMGEAFQSLRLEVTTPPVLAFPDSDRPFIVERDGSRLYLGVALALKKKNGKVHLVQLASRTMSSSEKKYATCGRKPLGAVLALEKFRVYFLSSISFTAFTNHQALRCTFRKKDVHGRLARWLDFLTEFDSKTEYGPGKMNIPAHYQS